MVMSRAVRMAENNIKHLQTLNARLSVDNQIMKPKADYFDELVDRNLLTNFRETAKQIGVKEKEFVGFVNSSKLAYRKFLLSSDIWHFPFIKDSAALLMEIQNV